MSDSPEPPIAEELRHLPAEVLSRLGECLLRDRPRLGREAARLRAVQGKRGGKAAAADFERLRNRFAASLETLERRRSLVPPISFPEELPVTPRRGEIARAVAENQVVIIAGSTGCGKTTQLPKICLEAGRGAAGMIGVTQPRRLAAVSVAARVARELGVNLGGGVGYQIRFQARLNPLTLVKFMTDGILLNEIRSDPEFLAYDTIILDEAHERSLDTDLLLGYMKRILPSRPELRLIVSSATLDTGRFSRHFDEAPVIELEGRTFPVEVRYRPPDEEDDDDPDLDVMLLHAVEELTAELPEGDILAFLPGEGDIREAADTLARSGPGGCLVLPLFSRLTPEEQQRVFQPTGARKIILATNVAETSLTIPGVRAVIDSGLARIRRVSDKASVERLQIEKISQASAEQRKGRAGRVAPGVCVRLYSERDYDKRPEYTDPEIRRASLASVILRLRSLGLGAVEEFPFLDPPQPSRLAEGYRELHELGALDDGQELTRAGRRMAGLPVEPRFSRILLEAARNGVLEPALTIVAMLSVQDPRERPIAKQGEADQAHRRFLHQKSDFLAWLELWKFYDDSLAELPSKSQARKFCRRNFLNYLRMQEWRDIRRQMAELMAACLSSREKESERPTSGDKDGGYARLHRALLAGLLGRMGKRAEEGDYQGGRGVRFLLWPGSGPARASKLKREASRDAGDKPSEIKRKSQGPAWVMAAELAETSRLFGRGVAEIDPLWAEELAGPLAKRTYSEPYYDERSGFVRAREKVMVYGLPIVEGRKMHYGGVNPAEARTIFIRQALVAGGLKAKLSFLRENLDLAEAVAEIAHKARQPLVASEESVFAFYDERLPADIHNDRALVKFALEAEKNDPSALRLTRDFLLRHPPDGITPERFPPEFDAAGRRYALTYRFLPGHDEDGVTLTCPVADVPNLEPWRLEWLVPGLLGARIAEAMRALPKSLRRELNPVADAADLALPYLGKPDRPLAEALSEAVHRSSGVRIKPEEWNFSDLPAYLKMNVRAVDAFGRTVGQGRDVVLLAQSLNLLARNAFESMAKDRHERTGLTAWDFGDIPERVEIRSGAGAAAFPALVDKGNHADLKLFHTEREAAGEMVGGFRRMVFLALDKQLEKLKRDMRISRAAGALSLRLGGGLERLKDDAARAAADEAFGCLEPVRTHRLFLERFAAGKERLYPLAMEMAGALDAAFAAAAALLPKLDRPATPAHLDSCRDMLEQLESLLSPEMIDRATAEQVRQLPRFVRAAEMRYERLGYALGKDKTRLLELLPYRQRYEAARGGAYGRDAEAKLLEYRWLLEEWRIGLFAQEPGVKVLGGPKKLDACWSEFKRAAE